MNNFEQDLKALPLTAPSANLDQRIDNAFAIAARERPSPRVTTGGWWLTAFASAGIAAAFIAIMQRQPFPRITPAVYRVEASGRMRQLLLEPSTRRETLPGFSVKTTNSD